MAVPLEAWQRDLIERHLDIARSVARTVARRSRRRLDPDDCLSAAYLGLVEAAQRYDPGRAIPFAPYAALRVRWRVRDLWVDRAHANGYVRDRTRRGYAFKCLLPLVAYPLTVEGDPDVVDPHGDIHGPLERRQLIERAIAAQPRERERMVLQRVATGSLLAEIGQTFGLGESSMSKAFKRAVRAAQRVVVGS